MRIIPAIDIIEGKCVRLTKGDYSTKKVYNEDPLEVAKMFEDHGIKYLHLVDLDGAKAKKVVNHSVLEAIVGSTKLCVDFGGGLKTTEDVRRVFESGASQLTAGSIAVQESNLFLEWLHEFGPKKVMLGADARDGKIAISGWQEDSDEDVVRFVKSYQRKGVSYVVCTDISKDGMLMGPSVELYKQLLRETKVLQTSVGMSGVEDVLVPGIKLIASGGISTLDDLEALKAVGCEGAIIGKAIYEGKLSLRELEKFF